MRGGKRRILTAAVVLTACALPALGGQAHDGEVSGRVRDENGRLLSGVRVTLRGPGLLGPRSADTGARGAYWFPALPVGRYTLSLRCNGFATEARDIQVDAGTRQRFEHRLGRVGRDGPAPASPSLSVPHDPGVAARATREMLDLLPSGRDARTPLLAVPGFTVASEVVGRERIDSRLGAYVNGSHDQAWRLDGGTVAETGDDRPPIWPLDSLEQVRVQLAAAEASVRGPGLTVNLVTRSATNRFAGSAHFDFTDWRLQADNLMPSLRAQGATSGTPVQQVTEASAEAGAPLARGRTWGWVSVSRLREQVGIRGFYTPHCLLSDGSPTPGASLRAACLVPDVALEWTTSTKVEHAWTAAHRSTVTWVHSSRSKPARGASPYDRFESTNRQRSLGFARPLTVRHEWLPATRLLLDSAYSFSDTSFCLDFQHPGLSRVQGAFDRHTGVTWRSGSQSIVHRPSSELQVTASAFVPALLGGEHAGKFGVALAGRSREESDRQGGGAIAVFDSRDGARQPWQGRVVRDGLSRHRALHVSAFAQDSYVRGPVTISGGVRYDRHDDRAPGVAIGASSVLPDLLPAVSFPAVDAGVVYNDISPRLLVAWEVGPSIVKAGIARYHAGGNETSAELQPTGPTRLVYWWNDEDGDGFVRAQELDLARGLAAEPTRHYNPRDPATPVSEARVDPALRSVVHDEVTVALVRELRARLTVRAVYVARKGHRFQASFPIEADGSPVQSESFQAVSWAPGNCPNGAECPVVTYYTRDRPLPTTTLRRNDGRFTWHHSLDVVLHKRLSDGWMLDASATWNRGSWHAPRATRDFTDPTNVAMRQGGEYSMQEAHWVARLAGSVVLPWGFTTSAVMSARQGFPYDRVVSSPVRGALGSANVSIGRYGAERYPSVANVDWRLDWKRRLGRLTVRPTLTLFNALNSNVVLERHRVQNSSAANSVVEVLGPRSARLELSVTW